MANTTRTPRFLCGLFVLAFFFLLVFVCFGFHFLLEREREKEHEVEWVGRWGESRRNWRGTQSKYIILKILN